VALVVLVVEAVVILLHLLEVLELLVKEMLVARVIMELIIKAAVAVEQEQ
jgi:hypothetical protein